MSTDLTISVVIPLFNKGSYIEAAVASVLQQRYGPHEVVVVDDGSTDDSVQRVLSVADPLVHVISQSNSGVSAARNRGIAHCTGDLVAFLDADDIYHPDYLATLARLHRQYPRAGTFCTGYTRVDATGRRLDMWHPRLAPGSSCLLSDFYSDWAATSFACTNSTAVRRSVLDVLPMMFPTGDILGEDQDLWFRLAELVPIAYCNLPLADYRVEVAGSATSTHCVLDVLPCYQRLGARLAADNVPQHMRRGARRLLASHLLNIGRARAAKGDLRGAVEMLFDQRAAGNPTYWLRVAALLGARSLGLV